MTRTRSAWATPLVLYAVLRRAVGKAGNADASPRALLWKVALIFLMMPCIGPTLWQALLVMPTSLAVFIALAIALRIIRFVWRRVYLRR
jgi:hypothetical protein